MEVERREVPLDEMTAVAGSDGQQKAIPAASADKVVKGKPPNPPLPVSCVRFVHNSRILERMPMSR